MSIPIPKSDSPVSAGVVSYTRTPINTRALSTGLSLSPTQTTLHDRFRQDSLNPNSIRQPKVLRPVDNEELRLLLLENISAGAVKAFEAQGFQVDHFTKSWTEDELVEKIGSYHAIGIRSKTKITKRVLKASSKVSENPLDHCTGANYNEASCHRLLLHRNEPSRLGKRSTRWHPRLQFTLLELQVCGGTRYGRDYCALSPAC